MDEQKNENSNSLTKLFKDAWSELLREKGKHIDDPSATSVEIMREGKKKTVSCGEFWIKMIKEVEEQKKSPNYLYTPEADQKISQTFRVVLEYPTKDEATFYAHGMYYTPRSSIDYLQNLNLGYDQWYVTQEFPPRSKVIKILNRECEPSIITSSSEFSIDLTSILSEEEDGSVIDLTSIDSADSMITTIDLTGDEPIVLSDDSIYSKYCKQKYTPARDIDSDEINIPTPDLLSKQTRYIPLLCNKTPIYVDDSYEIQLPITGINAKSLKKPQFYSRKNKHKRFSDNNSDNITPIVIDDEIPIDYSKKTDRPKFYNNWEKKSKLILDSDSDDVTSSTSDFSFYGSVDPPAVHTNIPIFIDDSDNNYSDETYRPLSVINSQNMNTQKTNDDLKQRNMNDSIFQNQYAEYLKWQRKMANLVRRQFYNQQVPVIPHIYNLRRRGFRLPRYSWLPSTSLHQIDPVPIHMPIMYLNPRATYPPHWPHGIDSALIYMPLTCSQVANSFLRLTNHRISKRLPLSHKYTQMPYPKLRPNWTLNGTKFLQPIRAPNQWISQPSVIGIDIFNNRLHLVILMSAREAIRVSQNIHLRMLCPPFITPDL